jgi:hypothetical protein
MSSSSSSSTVKTESMPHPASRSTHIIKPGPASPSWQKERWTHWEKLTKQHSVERKEQETLV